MIAMVAASAIIDAESTLDSARVAADVLREVEDRRVALA
jgi:hypothetical protein